LTKQVAYLLQDAPVSVVFVPKHLCPSCCTVLTSTIKMLHQKGYKWTIEQIPIESTANSLAFLKNQLKNIAPLKPQRQ